MHTLCTLFEFCTAAHAFLNGLFFCVHFTSRILLACFPPWLLCAAAAAVAAAATTLECWPGQCGLQPPKQRWRTRGRPALPGRCRRYIIVLCVDRDYRKSCFDKEYHRSLDTDLSPSLPSFIIITISIISIIISIIIIIIIIIVTTVDWVRSSRDHRIHYGR